MADLELDFWPPEKLNALVECLRAGIRTTDYKDQFELPSVEDLPFWQHAASQCDLPGALDGGGEDVALDLAECVHAEFGVRDLVKVSDQNVWLGDLSASESRLVMLQLGIKAIVTIASQEVDPLWKADGIEYHTVVINQCSGKGESLREQLESCCAFLSSRRPALVCCGSGNGPSVIVCSAVLAIDSGGVFSAQQALDLVASKRVHVEVSSGTRACACPRRRARRAARFLTRAGLRARSPHALGAQRTFATSRSSAKGTTRASSRRS